MSISEVCQLCAATSEGFQGAEPLSLPLGAWRPSVAQQSSQVPFQEGGGEREIQAASRRHHVPADSRRAEPWGLEH